MRALNDRLIPAVTIRLRRLLSIEIPSFGVSEDRSGE